MVADIRRQIGRFRSLGVLLTQVTVNSDTMRDWLRELEPKMIYQATLRGNSIYGLKIIIDDRVEKPVYK